jgi:serine/threonine protein kinase
MEDYYGIKSRRAREYIRSLPFKKKIPWKVMFPRTNDLALDLLERLLAFNPTKRITVEDALKHQYLEPYHDPDDEPTADPIPEEFFDFDKNKDNLTKEQLKGKSQPNIRMIHSTDQVKSAHLPGDYAIGVRCWKRALSAHDARNLIVATTIFIKFKLKSCVLVSSIGIIYYSGLHQWFNVSGNQYPLDLA